MAAQEKPTSPRRVIDVLEDHTFDASRGGRCSCGQWPASGERYHTEHVAAAIEREAAAATPSLRYAVDGAVRALDVGEAADALLILHAAQRDADGA